MHIFFADDSEQTAPVRDGLGHLVGYGGVLVPPDGLASYSSFLEGLRNKLDLPPDTEFKWSPDRTSPLFRNNKALGIARQEMLDVAFELEIKSIVVIADLKRLPQWSEDDAEREMLKYLYERVSGALRDVDDVGIVVADEVGGGAKQEKQWLIRSRDLTSNGTEYVQADRIPMPILTADSKHVPHLQLADLVVAASTSAVAGSQYGLFYSDRLHKLAHKNSSSTAGGTGIKLCPDHPRNSKSIINLHHWVFNEEFYCKVGINGSVRLPYEDWAFANDDGLLKR